MQFVPCYCKAFNVRIYVGDYYFVLMIFLHFHYKMVQIFVYKNVHKFTLTLYQAIPMAKFIYGCTVVL